MKALFPLFGLLFISSTLCGQVNWSLHRRANIASTLAQGKIVNDAIAIPNKKEVDGKLYFQFTFRRDFFSRNANRSEKLVVHLANFLGGFLSSVDSAGFLYYVNFFEQDDSLQPKILHHDWTGGIGSWRKTTMSKRENSLFQILPFPIKSINRFYANGCYCLVLNEESNGIIRVENRHYYGILAAVIHYYITDGKLDVKIYHTTASKSDVYTFNKDSDYELALRHIPAYPKTYYSNK